MADIIGLFGVMCVVGMYFLSQMRKVSTHSIKYSVINLVGASAILYSLFYDFNLAAFVIQILWIAASLIGLIKREKK